MSNAQSNPSPIDSFQLDLNSGIEIATGIHELAAINNLSDDEITYINTELRNHLSEAAHQALRRSSGTIAVLRWSEQCFFEERLIELCNTPCSQFAV